MDEFCPGSESLDQEASTHELACARESIVFQVIENFTLFLQDEQLLQVRRQELEAQRELLKQVRACRPLLPGW